MVNTSNLCSTVGTSKDNLHYRFAIIYAFKSETIKKNN